MQFIEAEWEGRIGVRGEIDAQLAVGLEVYARRQKRLHRAFAAAFLKQWEGSVGIARQGASGVLQEEPMVGEDPVDAAEGAESLDNLD